MLTRGCPLISCLALCVIFGFVIGVSPTQSQEAVFRPPPALPDRTSSFFHFISCENVDTGQLLNCTFRDAILGLKPPPDALDHNGGHQHDGDHPLTDNIPTGRFECLDCADTNPDPLVVEGFTTNREATVFHALPAVTGQIQRQASVTPPKGFICVTDCFKAFTLDVGVRGLEELKAGPNCGPSPPELPYIICRLDTDKHPQGTHGTPDTISRLKQVAQAYLDSTGQKLSINDLSLPKGGMFDLNGKWFVNKEKGNGHLEHRTGTDADINREDGGGVFTNCEDDQKLHKAVEKVNETLPLSAKIGFECKESGGRKHVDFD